MGTGFWIRSCAKIGEEHEQAYPESDLVTPKVTTGPIAGSRKIYARPDAAPDLKVPLREIVLDPSSGEPPLPVYDPSGPYTDPDAAIDVERGLAARPH